MIVYKDLGLDANWAVASPNTGTAFRSTAFRPDRFAAEACVCWKEFCSVLDSIPEDCNADLEAESLRLLSLRELVQKHASELHSQQAEGPVPSGLTTTEAVASPAAESAEACPLDGDQDQGVPSLEPPTAVDLVRNAEDPQPVLRTEHAAAGIEEANPVQCTNKEREGSEGAQEVAASDLPDMQDASWPIALRRPKRAAAQKPVKPAAAPTSPSGHKKRGRKRKNSPPKQPPQRKPFRIDYNEESERSDLSGSDTSKKTRTGKLVDETFQPSGKPPKSRPASKASMGAGKAKTEMEKVETGGVGKDRKKYHPRWKGEADLPDLSNTLQNVRQAPPNASRRGRYKSKDEEKPSRSRSRKQPKYEGLGEKIEVQRKKDFLEAAKVLKSVKEALSNSNDHIIPFQVRTEGHEVRPRIANPTSCDGPRLQPDEIILRIEIRMFNNIHHPLQVFLVPGCQKLMEMRKAIACSADRNMASLGLAKKAAFFYIEGTFYMDKRGARCTNLVEPIKQFCSDQYILPPPEVDDFGEAMPVTMDDIQVCEDLSEDQEFREADMARVTWNDVGLRAGPGARNVYCHQGCCEHLLVIKDVRRLHPDDPQHLSAYPLVVQEEQTHIRCCNICSDRVAQKVTYDDKCAPQTPAFWCLLCYRLMHYDEDDNLLYEHKVFDYQGG